MQEGKSPTPERIWQILTGFQMSAAFKAAVELGIFTSIAAGNHTASAIASDVGAAERGVRILCDTLTVLGLLTKQNGEYSLSDDAALFLNRNSPAYIGSITDFIMSPQQKGGFENLTAAAKNGGAIPEENASLDPESPMWATFARSMAPMMFPSANIMASGLGYEKDAPIKVLDIAAGHGIFGITVAQHYPNAQIYAVDWRIVLEVAQENAVKFGVADRYHKIEGSAFEVDLGTDYDVVLIPNFLHHFDIPTCEAFLKRVYNALKPDGQVLTS